MEDGHVFIFSVIAGKKGEEVGISRSDSLQLTTLDI